LRLSKLLKDLRRLQEDRKLLREDHEEWCSVSSDEAASSLLTAASDSLSELSSSRESGEVENLQRFDSRESKLKFDIKEGEGGG
jgi:hypothetical protein